MRQNPVTKPDDRAPAGDPATGAPRRIDPLTSLRFFAAASVVVYHMTDYALPGWRGGPIQKAQLAVDFFFILSGFILAHVYAASFAAGLCGAREFLIARIARIYPAHLAIMLVFAAYVAVLGALGFAYNSERYRLDSFLWHVTLLDAWGLDRSMSWNYPAWSISAEFAAYLAFPVLVGPLARLSRRRAGAALAAMLAGFVLLNEPLGLTHRTTDVSVLRVLPEFAMGILVWRLGPIGRHPDLSFCASTALVGLLVAAMAPDALIVAAFVAMIAFAADLRGPVGAALSRRPLVYLGEVSFSLYLAHALVLSAVYSAFRLPALANLAPAWAADALVLAAVIPAACLLHHAVERPGRDLVRRAFARRPAAATVPSGSASRAA